MRASSLSLGLAVLVGVALLTAGSALLVAALTRSASDPCGDRDPALRCHPCGAQERPVMRARSIRHTGGQSLVEFALVIGLLLFIVCAAFAAFHVVMTQATVADAASAAAHPAALIGGDDGPDGAVVHAAQAVLAVVALVAVRARMPISKALTRQRY